MNWGGIMLYGVLIVVAFLFFLKLKGKKACGPKCRLPKKPIQLMKDRKKEKEEIREKIKSQKGQKVKDLDLFKDFREKKEKGGKK